MNVTMEKNGNVGGVITVSLEEKDYQDISHNYLY